MQVTFVEALDGLMPGFDPEIGKLAQRILINPRKIDYHVGVLAKKVITLLDDECFRINCTIMLTRFLRWCRLRQLKMESPFRLN